MTGADKEGEREAALARVAEETQLLQADLGLDVATSMLLASRGIDTAERVKTRKPELWRAAKVLLGHGISPKKIDELLGMDIRIVLAIQREGERDGSIPPYKERTVRQLEAVITLGLDALMEKARDGKISAIELCALADKRELLSGGVTQRTEVVEAPEVTEFRRFLQASPTRMVSATGEISERAAMPAGGAPVAALGVGGGAAAVVEGEVLDGPKDTQSLGK